MSLKHLIANRRMRGVSRSDLDEVDACAERVRVRGLRFHGDAGRMDRLGEAGAGAHLERGDALVVDDRHLPAVRPRCSTGSRTTTR